LYLFNLRSEVLDDFGEPLFGVVVGAFPDWCLDKGENRHQGRLFGSDRNKWNSRPRPAVRIIFIIGGQLLGKQRDVVYGAREQSDMIECAGQCEYTVTGN